jgi:hypothetical protein
MILAVVDCCYTFVSQYFGPCLHIDIQADDVRVTDLDRSAVEMFYLQ